MCHINLTNFSCMCNTIILSVFNLHNANAQLILCHIRSRIHCCITEWTAEGCETDWNINRSVVKCKCNHLTNFAILVVSTLLTFIELELESGPLIFQDICSRFQDCTPSPPLETVLKTITIIGVGLSLIGIVATLITLLLFK